MADLNALIRKVSWQLSVIGFLKCLMLAASGYMILCAILDTQTSLNLLFALTIFCFAIWIFRVYQSSKSKAVNLIHRYVNVSEYSLELYQKSDLNFAEQLQLARIDSQMSKAEFPHLKLYNDLKLYFGVMGVAVIFYFGIPFLPKTITEKKVTALNLRPIKAKAISAAPELTSATIRIVSPSYTGIPERSSDEMNITAISGSQIVWEIALTNSYDVTLKLSNTRGEEVAFRRVNENFIYKDRLTGSGLYAIKGYRNGILSYESEFYKMEAIPDEPVKIEPASRELYQYHLLKDDKKLRVSASMSDDFKVKQSFIVATVARGSGENVKFREVKFPLFPTDFKKARVEKTIDLNQLGFAPGDELYYYWAAIDNKQPMANFSKSDTYFLVYKDTAQIEESELATMAVNLVPEYFRSQRQIIIDTEKLLAKEKKLSKKEFNEISNEIGFDQKVLRLRYGQYLGEEFETNIGGGPLGGESNADGAGIIDAFTHHSDGHGEGAGGQAPEPEHHHGNESKVASKDPLAALMEQYVHNHDDGEANTFYEQSTRSLLKMALEQMWQSELHLRIYEPKQALPFEYKALEYLKSAQQKARTYVKKSGYDPPPIKEKEKRLTGEMKDLSADLTLSRKYEKSTTAVLAAEILGYLDHQITRGKLPANIQFAAGTLSQRLVQNVPFNGMQNWAGLKILQKMMSGKELNVLEINQLKSWLYRKTDRDISNRQDYLSAEKLEQVFREQLR